MRLFTNQLLAAGIRLFAGCCIFLSINLNAAQKLNMSFSSFTGEDGLSQESVNAVIQDRQGFVWIGTQEGLNRFDGREFKAFYPDDSNPKALSKAWIWDLLEDEKGIIWIATDGGGLNRYDPETESFTSFKHDPRDPKSISGNVIRSLFLDSSGNLWLGTNSGLTLFDRNNTTATRFVHNKRDPGSLSSNRIRAIVEDDFGNLWVGTDGGGLNRFDRLKRKFSQVKNQLNGKEVPGSRIFSLSKVDDGHIWVSTYNNGVTRYHPTRNSFQHFYHSPEDDGSLAANKVKDVYQDSLGRIWLATAGGLDLWLPEEKQFSHFKHDPAHKRSIVHNHVLKIFEDKGGILWVGTIGGVSKWNPIGAGFGLLQIDPGRPFGLSGGSVASITTDSQRNLWVGTTSSGLNFINRTTGEAKVFTHDPSDPESIGANHVSALWLESDSTLWVATGGGGLNRLDIKTGKFKRFLNDKNDVNSISSNILITMASDKKRGLWLGTFRAGLNYFNIDSGEVIRFKHNPNDVESLGGDIIHSILVADNNTVWVGTWEGGLNRLDVSSRKFQRYKHDPNNPNTISDNSVVSLHKEQGSVIWVGTQSGGLNKLVHNLNKSEYSVTRYGRKQGLLSNTIYGILEGQPGEIWVSTNKGLTRLSSFDGSLQHFGINHGLQGLDFYNGAFHRADDGELLFGGKSGLNAFYPTQIQRNEHRPEAALTEIYVDDEKRVVPRGGDYLELNHNDYLLSVEYAGLDFAQATKNQYRYRLRGFDKSWIDAGTHGRAIYTKLPAGEYLFEVLASNNDGLWSEESTKLYLRVFPAPWLTWWAYTLYGLTAFAVLYWFINRQQKKIKLQEENARHLESLVEERTWELEERNTMLQALNRKLQQASVTDSLTGLKNRRYLEELALKEAAEIDREFEVHKIRGQQKRLFFGMIDLDNLKQINDTYGHKAGDAALVHVAQVLKQECRTSDTVIRWGGDEFMLLGHAIDEATLERIAGRVRDAIASIPCELEDGETIKLSCSVGVSFYPFCTLNPRSLNWEQVAAIADRAMYVAKEQGRNDWVAIFNRQRIDSLNQYENILDNPMTQYQEGSIALRSSRTSILDRQQILKK